MFTVFLKSPNCRESHSNLTEVSEELEKSLNQLRYIAYQIVAPSLIAVGILGNILNLLVLSRPFINECTRIYLQILAIADLHLLAFEISTIIRWNNLQDSSAFTALYYAHFELFFTTALMAFIIYVVLCLTVDRYISVCHPTKFDVIHTPKRAKCLIAIILVAAILVCSPLFLLKTTCTFDKKTKWGFEDNFAVTSTCYWRVYISVSESLIRIGPAIALAILNILIIRKFRVIRRQRNRLCKSAASKKSRKHYKEEKRLIMLLQAVILLFFLTMIPSSCLSFIYSEYKENDLKFETFRAIANLLEIANSALNFCAYYLCSKDFRNSILGLFGCSKIVAEEQSTVNIIDSTRNRATTLVGNNTTDNNTVVTITNLINKYR